MIDLVTVAIKLILVGCTLAAGAFYVLSIIAVYRFFTRRDVKPNFMPPVSIMVPLSGTDFNGFDSYASLCRQDYPEYQIVFGVLEPDDPSIPVIDKLMADFPENDIALVVNSTLIGENLKVSNLRNMLKRVKHEHIVIIDSDIRVNQDYLREVIPLLSNPGVGLVTCLYRAASAADFAAKLEAIAITAEFVPGVLMAWMLQDVRFALGSTMATTRQNLFEIGGFETLADYLADDFMLGKLIADRGYQVRVSKYIVETVMAPASFGELLKHQMRWGRSTRISRPLGYLGLGVTYGTVLALLTLVVDGASRFSLSLFGFILAVRLAAGWVIGVRRLGDRVLKRNFWLLPLRDLSSFGIWCFSWFGRRVIWRGRILEVRGDGKMIQVGACEGRLPVTESHEAKAGQSRLV